MSIALGTQNKKQVRIAVGLLAVVVLLAVWDLHGSSKTPAVPVVHAISRSIPDAPGKPARSELTGADFRLRVGELARSERVEYSNGGKDLFSATSGAAAIEAPLAPPRPAPVAAAVVPAISASAPIGMNLKYLGYAESGGTTNMSALFLHGDDMFVAKTGDIMFHRFRVGSIQVSNVQVTDLRDNRTQSIPVAAE